MGKAEGRAGRWLLVAAAALLLAGCAGTMWMGFLAPKELHLGMSKPEARKLLGAPERITTNADMHLETWEYPTRTVLFHYDSLFSWDDHVASQGPQPEER